MWLKPQVRTWDSDCVRVGGPMVEGVGGSRGLDGVGDQGIWVGNVGDG